MLNYREEDYLLLSGIQHFAFCPRQWALIHVEDKWADNYLTAMGKVIHNKAHDNIKLEKRRGIIIARTLKISSAVLGISGECDVVEFRSVENGITLKNCKGYYKPYPVEYKRGKSKINDCDRLQLCAQAICLEEMLFCKISKGALFYGETKKREIVEFSQELRDKVKKTIQSMHDLFNRQHTPKGKISSRCNSCSLQNECITKISKNNKSVQEYLEDGLL